MTSTLVGAVADLEATLASDPRFSEKRNQALVGLCRLLAEQIDREGPRASTRLTASYLSALKDLRRVTEDRKVAGDSGGSKLGNLRSVHGAA